MKGLVSPLAFCCPIEKHYKLVHRGNGGRLESEGSGETEDLRWDTQKQSHRFSIHVFKWWRMSQQQIVFHRSGPEGGSWTGWRLWMARAHRKFIRHLMSGFMSQMNISAHLLRSAVSPARCEEINKAMNFIKVHLILEFCELTSTCYYFVTQGIPGLRGEAGDQGTKGKEVKEPH